MPRVSSAVCALAYKSRQADSPIGVALPLITLFGFLLRCRAPQAAPRSERKAIDCCHVLTRALLGPQRLKLISPPVLRTYAASARRS
jgi:hypothetical protein